MSAFVNAVVGVLIRMSECMYVSVCVCDVCIHACMYGSIDVCIHACVCVFLHGASYMHVLVLHAYSQGMIKS